MLRSLPPARARCDRLAAVALVFALALAIAISIPAGADSTAPASPTGAIAGRVITPDGRSAGGGEAVLVNLRRHTAVAADGSFRFDVPPGEYLVQVDDPRLGTAVARVSVAAGEVAAVELTLRRTVVMDRVVVTASPDPHSQLEVAQPTDVLDLEDLDTRRQPSLGETLAQQPGISSTYFGPGASRPIIRGLGGDRVRMLENGLGSADASNTSPDHAVAVDPLAADRIEIIRGPATLLYGSSAVGGVVNVLDGRIPSFVPGEAVSGSVDLDGGSVADERSGRVSLDGGSGKLVWHADYLKRETGDYRVPDSAGTGGVLTNSSIDTDSGGVGLSYVGEHGFLGVGVSRFDSLYGVPPGDGEEGPIEIDLEQRRADLRGQLDRPFGPFRGLKVRVGVNRYEHAEVAGGEIGTRFTNDGWEGRFELVQEKRGRLSGAVGVQLFASDFAAIGEEAFVPPSVTRNYAAFAFEQLDLSDALSLQFGGRFETQKADPEGDLASRSQNGASGSLGLVWAPADAYSVALSASRTSRLPTANELFADGPHEATEAFEIGDPDLSVETATGADLSFRKRTGRLTGVVSAFATRFSGFIFESFTGEEEDGLQVIEFLQQAARFVGAELDGRVRLVDVGDGHLDLRFGADTVRADLTDSGDPVPRIPPLRARLGLEVHTGPFRSWAEVVHVDRQDRLGANETPTDGYTRVDAAVGYRFLVRRTVTEVLLRGTNLTDQLARNHVSFLKDEAPLPGRDVNLGVRITF